MISKTLWNELNKLSKLQLRKLATIMNIGLNDPFEKDLDKDEIVLILSTEAEEKIKKAMLNLHSRT